MDNIIEEEKLQATFLYLYNITICGKDQNEHDVNFKHFLEVASCHLIMYNESNCVFSTRKLVILGSIIEEGEIRPDPEHMCPLRELPVPSDRKGLNQLLGCFSYYCQWILCFPEKIPPLATASSFPISVEAKTAFKTLKRDIEESVVCAIDERVPFEVETDALGFAIAAILNQKGHLVAFFSHTLQGSEIGHAFIEKETQVIIETIHH